MPQETQQAIACHHCGDDCPDKAIQFQDHSFCCHGCRTVFELLKDSGLSSYYNIEKDPGSRVDPTTTALEFLELEAVQNEMLDFQEGTQARITFSIPTMHCSACIWLLEKLYKLNPGIQRSEVNFLKRECSVLFDRDKISLRELVQLLQKLGYAPDLQRNKGKTSTPKHRKDLIVKLGVAGFAFGNIMLLSLPDYLSMEDGSLLLFKPLFGYLSLLLSLPVLLYSSRGYFKKAWSSLRMRYLTIDVPISLGIAVLFIKSTWTVLEGSGPGYFDSFTGLVFFLLIGQWYQRHTYDALNFERDFKSYFPIAVARLKNGQEEHCLLEDIHPGDVLRIRNQQIIPADAELLSGKAAIDYSFVNGESSIVKKHQGDDLYAGGRQTVGSIEIKVTREIAQGYLTSLWNQQNLSSEERAKSFATLIDRTSRWFSTGVITIALMTLIYWSFQDWAIALDAFAAVLIIACPCALALAMPFAAGNVMRILGKRGMFIRDSASIERMASIDDIVFDKTGTLTDNAATLVNYEGVALSDPLKRSLFSVTSASAHPASQAIAAWLSSERVALDRFEELEGRGIRATVNNMDFELGSAGFCGVEAEQPEQSEVHLRVNEAYLGVFQLKKPLRQGIHEAIQETKSLGSLHLLSGDNEGERERMAALFDQTTNLHFHQSPQDKQRFIQSLENSGKRTMMLGDGLNDAGALRAASVGVAVADDVFSFSPACDAILNASQIKRLPEFLRFAHWSITVVRVALVVSLLYNSVGLWFAVQGLLTPFVAAILMPLSSVTVVTVVSVLTFWKRPT